MSQTLLELLRHKTWATLRLIEYCQKLADEHLDATIPGTFGTIRQTLRHLVGADEGYFSILTRRRLSEPLPDGVVKLDDLPDGPVPLDELAKRIRALGPRWELLAQDADVARRECTTTDGWRVPGSVPMGTSHPSRRRSSQPHSVDPRRTRTRSSRAQRFGHMGLRRGDGADDASGLGDLGRGHPYWPGDHGGRGRRQTPCRART
jgi:uncharacterized damage-inducible protein DinB